MSRIRQQFLGDFAEEQSALALTSVAHSAYAVPRAFVQSRGRPRCVECVRRDESLFDTLKKTLQKSHPVRLYGARSAPAFAELLDLTERAAVVRSVERDQRYFFFWQDLDATVFLEID